MKSFKELVELQKKLNALPPSNTEEESTRNKEALAIAQIELENWKKLGYTQSFLAKLSSQRDNLLSEASDRAEMTNTDPIEIIKFLVAANTIKRIIKDLHENPIINQ